MLICDRIRTVNLQSAVYCFGGEGKGSEGGLINFLAPERGLIRYIVEGEGGLLDTL